MGKQKQFGVGFEDIPRAEHVQFTAVLYKDGVRLQPVQLDTGYSDAAIAALVDKWAERYPEITESQRHGLFGLIVEKRDQLKPRRS